MLVGEGTVKWSVWQMSPQPRRTRLMPSAGNPLVYAERHVSDDARTVLIYAHYDVMPAEPLELWKSNPFEPEDGRGRHQPPREVHTNARRSACH